MTSRATSTLSAAVLAVGGVCLLFAGDEVAARLVPGSPPVVAVVMQLLGGAWLGVATLDWFTRGQSIGGIYGRPVVLCNLALYLVTATTSLKAATVSSIDPLLVVGVAAAIMAALYARLLFRPPA